MKKKIEELKRRVDEYGEALDLGSGLGLVVVARELITEIEKTQREIVTLKDTIADYQEYMKSDQETIRGLKKENKKLKIEDAIKEHRNRKYK